MLDSRGCSSWRRLNDSFPTRTARGPSSRPRIESAAAPGAAIASSIRCSARRRLSSTPSRPRETSVCRGPNPLPARLPSAAVVPLQVQQIIDDLKCQSQPFAIGVQACQLLLVRPADDPAQPEADRGSSRPSYDGGSLSSSAIPRSCKLGLQVVLLAADQVAGPGCLRQLGTAAGGDSQAARCAASTSKA